MRIVLGVYNSNNSAHSKILVRSKAELEKMISNALERNSGVLYVELGRKEVNPSSAEEIIKSLFTVDHNSIAAVVKNIVVYEREKEEGNKYPVLEVVGDVMFADRSLTIESLEEKTFGMRCIVEKSFDQDKEEAVETLNELGTYALIPRDNTLEIK